MLLRLGIASTLYKNRRPAGVRLMGQGLEVAIAQIVAETATTRITERGATRMDDQTSEASMELRKKEGYF